MTTMSERRARANTVSRASRAETLSFCFQVALPTLAAGVVKRRPMAMSVAERLRLDAHGIKYMHRLRSAHDSDLVRLRVPGYDVEIALSPSAVDQVLAEAPTPFTPATTEKRAALGRFQPHGLLVSDDERRDERRRVNEEALDTPHTVHRLGTFFTDAIGKAADRMAATSQPSGPLSWERFNAEWWRLVRRLVFGNKARNDNALTDKLDRLRLDANWGPLHFQRERLRTRFLRELGRRYRMAEDDSLAGAMRDAHGSAETDPAGQIPHWLFAFDAAGMALFRTLALLATHPRQADRVRDELRSFDACTPSELPYLRACVLESLRLWPTTPLLLRESLPDHGRIVVYTPFFHRDDKTLDHAHEFRPEAWLDGDTHEHPAVVPFSAGPARCPGRNLVLFVTSHLAATLLQHHEFRLASTQRLGPDHPLPATLDQFRLRFALAPPRSTPTTQTGK